MKLLLPMLAVLVSLLTVPAYAQWSVDRSSDPMDGTIRVAASTRATQSVTNSIGQKETPFISVVCRRNKGERGQISLLVGFKTRLFASSGGAGVRHRVDDQPVVSSKWQPSQSQRALFAPDRETERLILDLMKGGAFHFEVSPPLNSTQYTNFSLRKSSAAISEVLTNCTLQGDELQSYNKRKMENFRAHWTMVLRNPGSFNVLDQYRYIYNGLASRGVISGKQLSAADFSTPMAPDRLIQHFFHFVESSSICVYDASSAGERKLAEVLWVTDCPLTLKSTAFYLSLDEPEKDEPNGPLVYE